jgi:hypothetical protein
MSWCAVFRHGLHLWRDPSVTGVVETGSYARRASAQRSARDNGEDCSTDSTGVRKRY